MKIGGRIFTFSYLLTIGVPLVIGIIIGVLFQNLNLLFPKQESSISEFRGGANGFINPLLECKNPENIVISYIKDTEDKINQYIENKEKEGKLTSASVYFRDLDNGPWFGINEKEGFTPASLLKLPLMMAYFKEAETYPKLFEKKIKFEGSSIPIKQTVEPKENLEIGKEYSVKELIFRMIVYSDNDATNLLLKSLDHRRLSAIYLDLGIKDPLSTNPEDFMNVVEYATFFRILYNASYLTNYYSNEALKLLANVDFDKGIVLSVPPGVKVANKFGERILPKYRQLHDCGIVYHPKRPYLICIMTRGHDFDELAKMIHDISLMTYEGVETSLKR